MKSWNYCTEILFPGAQTFSVLNVQGNSVQETKIFMYVCIKSYNLINLALWQQKNCKTIKVTF